MSESAEGAPQQPNRMLQSPEDQIKERVKTAGKNPPSLKQRVARGAAALAIGLGLAHTAEQTGVADRAAEIFSSGREAASSMIEQKPGATLEANEVMVGNVLINISANLLNIRKQPTTMFGEEGSNKISWDEIRFINKTVIDGEERYTPIELKRGDIMEIENPEIVFGGIHGSKESDNKWVMLYAQDKNGDLGAVYIALGAATREYVKTSTDSRFVNLKNNPGEKPEITNRISVTTSEAAVSQ